MTSLHWLGIECTQPPHPLRVTVCNFLSGEHAGWAVKWHLAQKPTGGRKAFCPRPPVSPAVTRVSRTRVVVYRSEQ